MLEEIVAELKCPPYRIGAYQFDRNSAMWYIQARKWREDVDTGEWGEGHGGKYYISPYSTPEEIRQKALQACLAYAEHEVREAFTWNGRQIFGPHMDHNKLWEIANDKVNRK